MDHRKEIDGLRAVAVIPVILCHAGVPWFRGGFVGVDVFFVISGFLISSVIYRGAIEGTFSILSFYERRARRIIPALVVMVTVAFAAAYFTMLPDAFDNFGQSVVATFLFSNNVLLTMTSGYWDLAASFKPLLHTWSLGVEEQFYIAYPLLAIVVIRLNKKLFPVMLWTVLLTSFGLSVALSGAHPNSSFYLIHTRAWEIAVGALAAFHGPRFAVWPRIGGALSAAGLLMIVGAVVGFTDATPFPSFYAAVPCLGTALVLIFTKRGMIAYRFLTIPAMIGIGLISYSLYLWHQPLFAFARIASLTPPSTWLMLTLTAAAILVSYLSWRFVERPFRDRSRVSRRTILAGSSASACVLIVAGLAVCRLDGMPQRVPGIGLGSGDQIAYNERVFALKVDHFTTAKKHLLVVGNSTARDAVNVMIESHRFGGFEIIYRDDLSICGSGLMAQPHASLLADADAIVMAANPVYDDRCTSIATDRGRVLGKPFVLIGPKHFGYNLNAYIRAPRSERPALRARIRPITERSDDEFRALVPPEDFVDILAEADKRYGGLPVFDQSGEILSADQVHLTQNGATFFAGFLFDNPAWSKIFGAPGKGTAAPARYAFDQEETGKAQIRAWAYDGSLTALLFLILVGLAFAFVPNAGRYLARSRAI